MTAHPRPAVGIVAGLRNSSPVVRILLLTEFAFNLGFYLPMPYLATHLGEDLGFAGWLVGLILGIRVLSQQGMFAVGGSLADRRGYRPVILAGCVIRTVGFGALAIAASPATVIVAVVLVGFAAAMFSPAVQAYLALEAAEERVEAFALFNVMGQAGALIGPVVGLVILGVNFAVVASAGSVTFLAITVVLAVRLPTRKGSEQDDEHPSRRDWALVLANRTYLRFCAIMTAYTVLAHQMYLALPREVERATGRPDLVGGLFVASSLLFVAAQVRVTRTVTARWSPTTVMRVGLAVMSASFLPVLVAAGRGWAVQSDASAPALVATLAPVVAAVALLTLGMMATQPVAMAAVVKLNQGRRLGLAYGIYFLFGAVALVAVNTALGAAFDAAEQTGARWLPWLGLIGVGTFSAVAIGGVAPAIDAPATPVPPPDQTGGACTDA